MGAHKIFFLEMKTNKISDSQRLMCLNLFGVRTFLTCFTYICMLEFELFLDPD